MGESKRVCESEAVVPTEKLKEMMVVVVVAKVLSMSVSMGKNGATESMRKWK